MKKILENFRLRPDISEKLNQLSEKYSEFNKTMIVEMALKCLIQADSEGLLGEYLDRYYFNRGEKDKLISQERSTPSPEREMGQD